MAFDLDMLLEALRRRTPDGPLDGLEPPVWARIAKRRRAAAMIGAWGWRAALVTMIAAAGLFAGSLTTVRNKSDFSPFAVHSELAPSTLLESGA